MITTELIELKNGLLVALLHTPNYNIYRFELQVNAGADFEQSENSGISHFVEHMSLEGNAAYPNKSEFNERLALLGGTYNGWTSLDDVNLNISMIKTAYDLGLDYLFNAVTSATFPDKSMRTERNAIIDEIHNEDTRPYKKYNTFLQNHLCTKAGRNLPIAGTKSKIRAMSKSRLESWYKKMFQPQNATLFVAGDLSKTRAKILKQIDSTFGKWENFPPELYNIPERIHFRDYNEGSIKTLVEPTEKQAISTIAIKSIKQDKENLTEELLLKIISVYFTNTKIGVLYKKLRDDLGLIYSISSYSDLSYYAEGTLSFQFTTFDENLSIVNNLIYEELRKIYLEGFDQNVFEKAIKLVTNSFLVGNLDFFDHINFQRSFVHINREERSEKKLLNTYNSLTTEQANTLFRKILKPERLFVTCRASDKKYRATRSKEYLELIETIK